jgi:hypothetical protein
MATQSRTLPYGIGQLNLGWVLAIIALLVLLGLGTFAYSQQLIKGEIVTGLRDVGTRGGARSESDLGPCCCSASSEFSDSPTCNR